MIIVLNIGNLIYFYILIEDVFSFCIYFECFFFGIFMFLKKSVVFYLDIFVVK